MVTSLNSPKRKIFIKLISLLVLFFFAGTSLCPPGYCASSLALPSPTQLLNLSANYSFPILKGIKINPDNPLQIQFVIDTASQDTVDRVEVSRLIRYFLAGLTIPEDDLWVNLSVYEKDRIVNEAAIQTDVGRDMLAQDYVLKQLVSSLTYPENETGRNYWQKTYQAAAKNFGTTRIPVNTFNKIWITPDKAEVYEHNNIAVVNQATLKAMLEEDFLALNKSVESVKPVGPVAGLKSSKGINGLNERNAQAVNKVASDVMREVVVPKVTDDVNHGKNFATLRQIYYSLILAKWFKEKFKESFYKHYINQKKIKGIDINDPQAKEKIYNLYTEAFKKGIYDYIKKESDVATHKQVRRRYFSGGVTMVTLGNSNVVSPVSSSAIASSPMQGNTIIVDGNMVRGNVVGGWTVSNVRYLSAENPIPPAKDLEEALARQDWVDAARLVDLQAQEQRTETMAAIRKMVRSVIEGGSPKEISLEGWLSESGAATVVQYAGERALSNRALIHKDGTPLTTSEKVAATVKETRTAYLDNYLKDEAAKLTAKITEAKAKVARNREAESQGTKAYESVPGSPSAPDAPKATISRMAMFDFGLAAVTLAFAARAMVLRWFENRDSRNSLANIRTYEEEIPDAQRYWAQELLRLQLRQSVALLPMRFPWANVESKRVRDLLQALAAYADMANIESIRVNGRDVALINFIGKEKLQDVFHLQRLADGNTELNIEVTVRQTEGQDINDAEFAQILESHIEGLNRAIIFPVRQIATSARQRADNKIEREEKMLARWVTDVMTREEARQQQVEAVWSAFVAREERAARIAGDLAEKARQQAEITQQRTDQLSKQISQRERVSEQRRLRAVQNRLDEQTMGLWGDLRRAQMLRTARAYTARQRAEIARLQAELAEIARRQEENFSTRNFSAIEQLSLQKRVIELEAEKGRLEEQITQALVAAAKNELSDIQMMEERAREAMEMAKRAEAVRPQWADRMIEQQMGAPVQPTAARGERERLMLANLVREVETGERQRQEERMLSELVRGFVQDTGGQVQSAAITLAPDVSSPTAASSQISRAKEQIMLLQNNLKALPEPNGNPDASAGQVQRSLDVLAGLITNANDVGTLTAIGTMLMASRQGSWSEHSRPMMEARYGQLRGMIGERIGVLQGGGVTSSPGGIKMSNIPVTSSPASSKIELGKIGPDFFDHLTFNIVSLRKMDSLAEFAALP